MPTGEHPVCLEHSGMVAKQDAMHKDVREIKESQTATTVQLGDLTTKINEVSGMAKMLRWALPFLLALTLGGSGVQVFKAMTGEGNVPVVEKAEKEEANAGTHD